MSVVATGKSSPLSCPNCDASLSARDISLDLGIGLCPSCDSSFPIGTEAPRRSAPKELMSLSAPPKGIQVETSGGGLVFTRVWLEFGFKTVFMVIWCVMWDGFLVAWYSSALGNLMAGDSSALLMVLFPILHVVAGIAVTYAVVATFVNRTVITLNDTHLIITHGPLPWSSPEPVPLGAIDQLYLVQSIQKNSRSFNLVARRKDLTSVQLLTGLSTDVQARFLERRIEAHLGLDDEAVGGEYTG